MAEEVLIAGGPNRAKIRNPWGVLGLLLVTLGIYSVFWWYYVNREMRDYGHATGNDLAQNPMNSALAWFPGALIIVPHIVTAWRGTLRAQSAQRVAGLALLSGWIALILYIFLQVPMAQPEAGGIAQKIFYYHVPAAMALYLCGGVLCLGSILYLLGATDARDAWAQSGAECASIFGGLVMVSGPLWAKKAWGVYWTWDPRLTTLLLSILIYVAIVLLRSFAGGGEAEKKFAAAFGVLGSRA